MARQRVLSRVAEQTLSLRAHDVLAERLLDWHPALRAGRRADEALVPGPLVIYGGDERVRCFE